jgi:ABC-type branched-subunit amino acid transport system substrate-binding protein
MTTTPNSTQGTSSTNQVSNSSQGKPDEQWGCIATIFITLGCLIYVISFIASAWSTGNLLFILGAISSAFIGLLAVPSIHNLLTKHVGPFLKNIEQDADKQAKKVIEGIERGVVKAWKLRNVILVFIILGFVINDYTPIPSMVKNGIYNTLCIQNQLLPTCGNGIHVTSMQVNGDSMNIGIIGDQNASPFNQFDDHNDDAERKVEKLIFDENKNAGSSSYVTLIVATTLSQTMSDPGISSSAGIDILRGAYMAQFNYNHDPNNDKTKLRLLIANFGTKDAASTTVPWLIDQIKLYADSDPQHFIGVVGFPFSDPVRYALDERYRISRSDIPIITSAAEADNFTDASSSNAPAHFYDNFYSIAPSVSDHGQVISDFIQRHPLSSSQTLQHTAVFVDSHNTYSSDLSNSIIRALGGGNKERYTVGQPDTLDHAIADVINNKYNQIFFAGYANDFNILRNKLKANPATQDIPIIGGEGLYYPYPAVYDNSGNSYNYAKLLFTTDATYAQTNPNFSDYIPSFSCSVPDSLIAPTPFNNEFCHWFYHANPPSVYGYALPGFHTLLIYDAVNLFLKTWDQRDDTSSPYWKVIDKQLTKTPIEGITGHIQYDISTGFHPISKPKQFKPVYVACTDSNGRTHIVAEYHIEHQTISDSGVLSSDSFNPTEEDQCTK